MLKERYQRFFPLDEACPEGSIPSSGKCKKKDNSGYLRGKCSTGYRWDNVYDRCIPLAKEETEKK